MSEQLVNNSQKYEYMNEYERVNANKTLWNPLRVATDYTTSYFVEDGSFLRLQNLTVGYTLPKTLTHNWGINSLRIYLVGDNIWLASKRKGFDPRQSIDGTTGYIYSALSSYSIGVSLSF